MEMRYSRKASYVQGSAAPAIHEGPVRVPRRKEELTKEEIRRRQADKYAENNRRKAGRFGFVYAAFIAACVFVTLCTCIKYIGACNKKTTNNKQIVSLTKELSAIKENNEQKQLEIDTSINYDYIYKVATEELGMVHAGKEQVVEYKSGESEYVIQYKNISSKN